MAAKMRKPTSTYRKISKPVISSDIMGNRNVEVRAVGAWVQAEPTQSQPEAVLAAEEEELRLRQVQLEKQARLKHFQQEIKKRVVHLDKLKKKAQLETNYKAAERERNIVCQSAFSSQDYAKTDNCSIRPVTELSVIETSVLSDHVNGSFSNSGDVQDSLAFTDQTNQVHEHVRHAKHNLVSRRVITEHYAGDDLPGGVWKISRTRVTAPVKKHPSSQYTVDGEEFDLLDDDLIEKVKIVNNKEYTEDKENLEIGSSLETDRQSDRQIYGGHGTKSVKFCLEKDDQSESRNNRIQRRSQSATVFSGTDIHRNIPSVRVPNIYEGVETEEEKKRARSQHAMYRRLFMDIEREQVKENLRRQEHRKRIQKLKKDKEEERQKEEQYSQQLIEPRDPVTGETSIEAIEREEQEKKFIRQTLREHERKVRKQREMDRYIEALRQQLKEKTRRKNVELPPLCCCGDTVWDTNPETCANNCVFYKNPKDYGRALQAMLDSSELVS